MTASRATVLWGRVAEHAAAAGRRVMIEDVCAVAVSCARVSGAWVVAASSRGPDFVICVTGQVSEQLAELQQLLGEGPCHDVLAAAAPVLAADLRDEESGRRWPAFAPEARRTGAAAVFAFPLVIGAIRAGVIGLYRDCAGPLSGLQLGDCLLLADTATVLLLDSVDGGGTPAWTGTGTGTGVGCGLAGSPPVWPGTGWRSTRPPGCLPCSWGSPPRKPLPGSGHTLMRRTGGSPMWLVTSSRADCAWSPIHGTPVHETSGQHDAGSGTARRPCTLHRGAGHGEGDPDGLRTAHRHLRRPGRHHGRRLRHHRLPAHAHGPQRPAARRFRGRGRARRPARRAAHRGGIQRGGRADRAVPDSE